MLQNNLLLYMRCHFSVFVRAAKNFYLCACSPKKGEGGIWWLGVSPPFPFSIWHTTVSQIRIPRSGKTVGPWTLPSAHDNREKGSAWNFGHFRTVISLRFFFFRRKRNKFKFKSFLFPCSFLFFWNRFRAKKGYWKNPLFAAFCWANRGNLNPLSSGRNTGQSPVGPNQ